MSQVPTAADRAAVLKPSKASGGSALRVVHTVSSLKVGGMEHFVLRIADAMGRNGHQTSIVALQGGALVDEARKLGLRVVVLGGGSKVLRALRGAFAFARLRPDIINAHNETSLHYAALGKRVSGAKVVLTNHGQGMTSYRDPADGEWHATDSIVTVSDAVAQRMDTARLGHKITTIYNGVTFSPAIRSRAQVRKELGIPENRVVGIIVARMDNLKGHDTLIRAAAVLRQRAATAPVTLLIAGDGAERANRESLAKELGLSEKDVRFLGFRSDVPDLLAASDFFTLPSLTEGLPLSILEAMTHRLPTVATPVGGIPELITDGTHGLLTPVNDADALAAAVATLASNPVLRQTLGEAAAERARGEFSFEQMTRRYEALYYRLCHPAMAVAAPEAEKAIS
jgi:glycosyltransferase involved in cell wall biosynthesis